MFNMVFEDILEEISLGNKFQDEILWEFLAKSKEYYRFDIRRLINEDGVGVFIEPDEWSKMVFKISGRDDSFRIMGMNVSHLPIIISDNIPWADACQKIVELSDLNVYRKALLSSKISDDYKFPANHPIITNIELLKYLKAISYSSWDNIDPSSNTMESYYILHNGFYIRLSHSFINSIDSSSVYYHHECADLSSRYNLSVMVDKNSKRFDRKLSRAIKMPPSFNNLIQGIFLSQATFEPNEVSELLGQAYDNISHISIPVATVNISSNVLSAHKELLSEEDALKIIERVNALEK